MQRPSARTADQLRDITLEAGVSLHAEGSVSPDLATHTFFVLPRWKTACHLSFAIPARDG